MLRQHDSGYIVESFLFLGGTRKAAYAREGTWGCYFRVFSLLPIQQRTESRTYELWGSSPKLVQYRNWVLDVPGKLPACAARRGAGVLVPPAAQAPVGFDAQSATRGVKLVHTLLMLQLLQGRGGIRIHRVQPVAFVLIIKERPHLIKNGGEYSICYPLIVECREDMRQP